MEAHVVESMEEVLAAFGVEPTTEVQDQLLVFLTALKIFDERDKVYGDTWTTYGGLNNLLRAATKVDRSMEVWWHDSSHNGNPLMHKDNLDDAIDAINYLAFFIRCVRSGNITGSPRQRPYPIERDDFAGGAVG
jgi:hypothetical protein